MSRCSWLEDMTAVFMANSNELTSGTTLRRTFIVLATCYISILSSPALAGTTYGIFDARTLAMGGVSVASANNDSAQFYNAALLAFNEEIEERTEDSRFLFPLLIPQVAKSIITIEELAQDDPAGAITRAVNDFNATPDALNAQAVLEVTAGLDASLAELDDDDLFADIYFGMAISEPGKLQGAGFFLGTRILAGGQSTVTGADRAILAAYQEGLTFVASNGGQGVAHPELFDANGALIDPGGNFDSSVTAAGAVITEAGVAMSGQFHLFGQPIAAGFSFKVLDIETFEDIERVVDDRLDVDQNTESEGTVNFDIGFVKQLGEYWRLGLAVKDLIPYNYDTSLGTTIRLRPRARFGVAYQKGRLQIAADADLTQSEPLGTERPTQEVAVGAEWTFESPFRLRAGYRYDIQSHRDGVASLGVGTLWRRLAVDLAYAEGNDAKAAALQFGIAF